MGIIKYHLLSLLIFCALLPAGSVYAQEFTATDFKILDPVQFSGGYFTSSDYSLFGAISQIAIGTSTAASFNLSGGFLYYPFVTAPTVSAIGGDGKVDLSWSASSAGVGLVVGGYNVGQSTTNGGPYTFTSLGDVLSASSLGLANGTTYYFVVQVRDVLNNIIATSTQVTAVPVASAPGGGGGGSSSSSFRALPAVVTGTAEAQIVGIAYPRADVVVLKNAKQVAYTQADNQGNFAVALGNLSPGLETIGIYATDLNGQRSSTEAINIRVTKGVAISVDKVIVPPTVKSNITASTGRKLSLSGSGAPGSQVFFNATVNESTGRPESTVVPANGLWKHELDISMLGNSFIVRAQTKIGEQFSPPSTPLRFDRLAGELQVRLGQDSYGIQKSDLTNDLKVNLLDFSVMTFWYHRKNPPPYVDLNNDKVIDIQDLSILAYYWTG